MTRRIAGLLVAAVFLVPIAPAAASSQPAPDSNAGTVPAEVVANAVTWKVDHAARTITATVRLQLGSMCTRAQYVRLANRGTGWKKCLLDKQMIDDIKANIDKVWNQGLAYSCYTLKLVTDIQVLNELDGPVAQSAKAPTDRMYIAIDQTPGTARSSVRTTTPQSPNATWNSRNRVDRLEPLNGTDPPSTWRYPPTGSRGLYGHELGHVLGIDDGYADVDRNGTVVSEQRSDAPAQDIMTDDDTTTVDPSTVRILVERAGISDFDLKCDYTVDRDTGIGKIQGTKCGGLEGDWIIKTDMKTGPTTLQQTFVITMRPAGTTDRFTYKDSSLTSANGSVTTSKGQAAGTAQLKLKDDGSATWTLTETEHTASGVSKVAGRTFKVPKTSVPLVPWTWDWRPTVCSKS